VSSPRKHAPVLSPRTTTDPQSRNTKEVYVQHDIIHILIPPGMWRDDRGDETKLHCVISISGTMMHLEAIEVREVAGVQAPVNPEFESDFICIGLFGNEGQFDTTEINGKHYVLVATPFT
jgi:hypothetical protein